MDCADIQAVYDANINNGKVCIGNAVYSKVVVFDVGDEERKILEYLKEKSIDAVAYDSSLEFLKKSERFFGETEDLLAYKKKNESGEIFFIFNVSKLR